MLNTHLRCTYVQLLFVLTADCWPLPPYVVVDPNNQSHHDISSHFVLLQVQRYDSRFCDTDTDAAIHTVMLYSAEARGHDAYPSHHLISHQRLIHYPYCRVTCFSALHASNTLYSMATPSAQNAQQRAKEGAYAYNPLL